MTRILAVDDEFEVLDTVKFVLEKVGYQVDTAEDPIEALGLIKEIKPDLVVLDIAMPVMNGIEICRRIRSDPHTARIPILFLTAKGQPDEIAHGLDAGGDDYLTKPFEIVELPARVRALLRRTSSGHLDPRANSIFIGDLRIDISRPEVTVAGRTIKLTSIEHRLLYYLAVHSGQPVSIDMLLQEVWEYPSGIGNPNVAHVTIKRLRDKIEPSPGAPEYLLNVWGEGYMLTG